jgi:serpin B
MGEGQMRSQGHFSRYVLATLLSLSLVAVIGLPVVGCGSQSVNGASVLEGKSQTKPSPQANSDMSTVATAGNAFAFDLFGTLRSKEQNLVYSPYGLSVVLSMAMGGAKGDTYQELADTLHLDLPADRLFPALGALDQSLDHISDLTSASSLWGQKGLSYQRDYIDLLGKTYGAPLRLVDFQSDYPAAVKTINEWASKNTNGRIPQVAAPGSPPAPPVNFMLTNAVYLKAKWVEPFKPEQTSQGPFHLPVGESVQVPIMHRTGHFNYASLGGLEAVEIPYKDGRLSFVALVPALGQFESVGGSLSSEQVERLITAMADREVSLGLPRFTFSSSPDVTAGLRSLGLVTPFTGAADFSGIATIGSFVFRVAEEAFIVVDEEGTEAAAGATVVGVASAPDVMLMIDRPFYFLVRDTETGAILFLGQVTDPRG